MSKPVQKTESNSQQPDKAVIRVIISGPDWAVDQVMREFYLCRFAELTDWTKPIPHPSNAKEVTRTYTRRMK